MRGGDGKRLRVAKRSLGGVDGVAGAGEGSRARTRTCVQVQEFLNARTTG
jgi:hypothetical protein